MAGDGIQIYTRYRPYILTRELNKQYNVLFLPWLGAFTQRKLIYWPLSLVVCRTRLSTYGDRAFPVAASRVWNSLPHHVTSAQSLPVFCSRLKTHLFSRFSLTILLCLRSDTRHYGHINRCSYLLTYLLFVARWRHLKIANCLWHADTVILGLTFGCWYTLLFDESRNFL